MTTAEGHTALTDAAGEAGDEIADETRSKAGQIRDAVGGAVDRVPEVIDSARTGAERVAGQVPDAAERAKGGILETNATLQALPDPTLRLLAATSTGLAAGLQLAGAPRLVTLVAIAARGRRRPGDGLPAEVDAAQRQALTDPRLERAVASR